MFFVSIVSGKFSKTIEDNLPIDTILNLKKSINFRFKIPIDLLKLTYKGTQLDDNKKISDYFIQNFDKIDLSLELLEINFFKHDAYQLKWYVEKGVTIGELEKRIIGIIYGIVNFSDKNYILKDGDIIFLI